LLDGRNNVCRLADRWLAVGRQARLSVASRKSR